jgi:hypothetical protein
MTVQVDFTRIISKPELNVLMRAGLLGLPDGELRARIADFNFVRAHFASGANMAGQADLMARIRAKAKSRAGEYPEFEPRAMPGSRHHRYGAYSDFSNSAQKANASYYARHKAKILAHQRALYSKLTPGQKAERNAKARATRAERTRQGLAAGG